ncbi:MAG: response regulator [Acetatifactor sp.]|nr:response regulator [Acetatifactor sp.]
MTSLQWGCGAIILLMALFYYSAKREQGHFHRIFSLLLILTEVYFAIDIKSVHILHGTTEVDPTVFRLVLFAYYSMVVILTYVAFLYVVSLIKENYQEFRIKGYRWCIPMVVALVSLALTPFQVKESSVGKYISSTGVACTYVAIGIYILTVFGLFIKYWKGINRKKRQIIFGVALVMAFCVLCQAYIHAAAVTAFAVTVLVMGLYLCEESPDVRLIQALQKEKARADAANSAKSAFLANMSHEMRTPINAIMGMNEMILRETREEGTKEQAIDIRNAAQILQSLINDVLDLSKIESGKMEIIPVEYQLSSLINDLINMATIRAKAKNLELKVEVDPELPSVYFGDDVRIRQVLMNLLTNAVKYTNEGSVTLTVKRTLVLDGLAILTFSVTDTGVGIKQEDMEKLYAAFERIEEENHRNEEGTGLGMSISTSLLELMGSKIQVESEYGKGSRFFFNLDQRILDPTPIGDFHESIKQLSKDYSYDARFTAPDAKILVVDDNAVNRKVFAGLLKKTKVQVTEADSGKACLELVGQQHFDLIFLDHMMPEMDGVETLQHMKELPESENQCQETPVIILTANAISGVREEYLKQGFDEYLSKPIDPIKLEAMIRDMLPKELVHEVEIARICIIE